MKQITERQREVLEMWQSGLKQVEIAEKLKINVSSVHAALHAAKKKLTAHPTNPMFQTKAVSELIDNRTGESVMTWYKSSREQETLEQVLESMLEGVKDRITKVKPTPPPQLKGDVEDRQNVFVFGDSHVNMLSWQKETGADWDQDIALSRHLGAMSDLITRAPKAGTGILATMGDLLHNDSLKPLTASGTLLDVDGRLGKAIRNTVAMLRKMIDKMLKIYSKVKLVVVRGNHSETLELLLSQMIELAYEDEPRLEVVDNTSKHIAVTFGKNFLLFTHGDKLNDQKKANIAVSKFRHLHGAAKFTHVLCGHVHHASQKEISGALVETFPALPTPDAWHYESGFVTADQSATVLTYHKKGGITERTLSYPRIFTGAA